MKKFLRIASMVLATLLFFSYDSLKAQVKIGGNPAVVDPDAILELESNRKGLLLPRLNDAGFTALKAANPTQGMVIYYTGATAPGAGFYLKTGPAITDWVKMASDGGANGAWTLNGNSNAAVGSFLGTPVGTNVPLVLKAAGQTGLTVGVDGKLVIPYANVDVAAPALNEVLLIEADGTLRRKSLDLTSVKTLNGLQGDVVIEKDPDDNQNNFSIAVDAVNKKILIKTPVMTGGATQEYGFMKLDDWKKLQAITSTDGFTVAALLTGGTQDPNGGKFTYDAVSGKWSLSLNEATETAPGLITTGAQTLAGNKTFKAALTTVDGDLVVKNDAYPGTGNVTLDGKLKIGDAVDAPAPAAGTTYEVMVRDATEVKKVTIPSWKLSTSAIASITTPAGTVTGNAAAGDLQFATGTTGTDFAIANSPNKITFNIPDASATARGLMTINDQTFEGNKTFNKQVTVGSGVAANSNLNINGSVGVNFREVANGVTLGANDYIVLIKTGAGDVSISLPDATTCSGRVYIIKRIPQGVAVPADETTSVIVNTSAGQTINGVSNTKITVPHTSITLMSDGTNWQMLSRGPGL